MKARADLTSPNWQNFGISLSGNSVTASVTNDAMIFRVRGQ
ncbi:MAG: hypothetical protein QM813_02995 [Verrucomicrobiota bacterium]